MQYSKTNNRVITQVIPASFLGLLLAAAASTKAESLNVSFDGILARVPAPAISAEEAILRRTEVDTDLLVDPVLGEISEIMVGAGQMGANVPMPGMAGIPAQMPEGGMSAADAMAMATRMMQQMANQTGDDATGGEENAVLPDDDTMTTVQECLARPAANQEAFDYAMALSAATNSFNDTLENIVAEVEQQEYACNDRENITEQAALACRNGARAAGRTRALQSGNALLEGVMTRLHALQSTLTTDIAFCASSASSIATGSTMLTVQGESVERTLLGRIQAYAEAVANLTTLAARSDILQPEPSP